MSDSSSNVEQLIGQMLGPYRVEKLLGEGGMGIVYRAVHQALGQHVAIKVLRRNFADDEKALQRFFNEARAVGIVQHPGLVRIHDYQQTQSGIAYIVMELLAGEALDTRMKAALQAGQRLALAVVLQAGQQVASALAAAHAAGIVHCGLWPRRECVRAVP
jgi:serine/threonine protein kinase